MEVLLGCVFIFPEPLTLNPEDPLAAEDEEDAEFFYDEEEVLAGADPAERAAMLDHYDSLLHMPRADDLDEVLSLWSPLPPHPSAHMPRPDDLDKVRSSVICSSLPGAHGRAGPHYDSLLHMPRADDLDEVRLWLTPFHTQRARPWAAARLCSACRAGVDLDE